MSYEKRVCVLKQLKKGFTADGSALSGAVYVERMGDELTVMPRLLGIAPVKDGRYALALWIDGGVYVAELEGAASVRLTTPSVKAGLAVLLVYVRGTVEAVAFGSCGVAPTDHTILLSAFEKQEKKRPAVEKTSSRAGKREEKPAIPQGSETKVPSFRSGEGDLAEHAATYDDEAIAESDYFRTADHGDGEIEERDEEAAADGHEPQKDDGARHPFHFGRGALTYYVSVREKLGEAFEKFPKDDRLTSVFPCSEWVKTDAALLGILYENGMPRYLCVAVEAREGDDPPESMKGHCRFVPASPVSDMVGFFIVFQSADTGEYVTVYDD